jgi:three-Cys-motif partner protein
MGSPLLALEADDPFDEYVFCEKDIEKLQALTQRVATSYGSASVDYQAGDINSTVTGLIAKLPMYSRTHRVLTFCFIDPYKLGDLWFTTIEQLDAARAMDFLVLIPTQMDAGRGRNMEAYSQPDNETLDRFLGGSEWRQEWGEAKRRGTSVDLFVPDCFGRKMKTRGFIYEGVQFTKQVRTSDRNVPLYRLAFFSKSKLGWKFWLQALKYSDDQIPLL